MDSHERDHRLLAGFVAGHLAPADGRRWDEHLLDCERCWRAVREDRAGRDAAALLRQPAPHGLADRVAFAVEVAAAARTTARRQARPGTRSWRRAPPGGGRGGGWVPGAGGLAPAPGGTLPAGPLPAGARTGRLPR